jgi:Domain of unknown function (DUF1918)
MEVVDVATDVPSGERPYPEGLALRAEVGDTLVIDDGGVAGIPRTGTIIAVIGQDGSPPYLVHWLAGDYESQILPGPGARVEAART